MSFLIKLYMLFILLFIQWNIAYTWLGLLMLLRFPDISVIFFRKGLFNFIKDVLVIIIVLISQLA